MLIGYARVSAHDMRLPTLSVRFFPFSDGTPDKGIVLAASVLEALRSRCLIIPPMDVVERICSEAITRANRRIYATLTDSLSADHRRRLDELFRRREGGNTTWLGWLRQSPARPNSRHMLEHIERLKVLRSLDLPIGIERMVHQNRLLKMAREGAQMATTDLAKFETQRRYATLVAIAFEGMATVTDEIIDLNDRIIGKLFNTAKNRHQQRFQLSGKAINKKVRLYGRIGQVLLDAKLTGEDPFSAIESVLSWNDFAVSVKEAQKLAQPVDFDFLHHIGESYATLRRYAPEFLAILNLRAAPTATCVVDALNVLRDMYDNKACKIPADAPIEFIKSRWEKLVVTDKGLDRRHYELCAMSELKNALRSGDVWIQGSRQYKDFDEYLVPVEKYATMKSASALPLAVSNDCDRYLHDRLSSLSQQLAAVDTMAAANELPDAIITESGLKTTPLDAAVPDVAQALVDHCAMLLPQVKITELLMEVDEWTGFTNHFTHLKTGDIAKDKISLLTTILADGINLGLTKMAESCPGTTYAKMSWLQAWHIRDETYSTALSEIVNAQFCHPFAKNWGEGCTSSSDGQRFRAGGKAENTGHINPKYGHEPGRMFYTHISDQYAPFSTKVINVGLRDSTLMLRKLGGYPRQNSLALALRELGRIERTLFMLDWLQSLELRRRVQIGLNKGEARNALARAVFFCRLGEIRDRSFEQQRYRASGLNLITAAIVLWNTVYLERTILALRDQGRFVDNNLLQYLSPLGWGHIILTGDYLWQNSASGPANFRPLRSAPKP